ncbi:hypothetical protein [Kribbella turkmenica]|uniref:hypothetical protein n=1 Tax=Kribbella turkmenica TaxID=2530375 RepID=UPI0014054B51|nr:hypothetical protein [Kribbella turkmenica]
MYLTPDYVKAETDYRRERITREYRAANRRKRAERTARTEPRHARRVLRPTTAA